MTQIVDAAISTVEKINNSKANRRKKDLEPIPYDEDDIGESVESADESDDDTEDLDDVDSLPSNINLIPIPPHFYALTYIHTRKSIFKVISQR